MQVGVEQIHFLAANDLAQPADRSGIVPSAIGAQPEILISGILHPTRSLRVLHTGKQNLKTRRREALPYILKIMCVEGVLAHDQEPLRGLGHLDPLSRKPE